MPNFRTIILYGCAKDMKLLTVWAGRGKPSLETFAFRFFPGGAKACNGSTGQEEHHQPPLIFNLQHDGQEQEPLDNKIAEYHAVLPAISQALLGILLDIATDNVSVADYSHDPAATPCCNPHHLICRCQAG